MRFRHGYRWLSLSLALSALLVAACGTPSAPAKSDGAAKAPAPAAAATTPAQPTQPTPPPEPAKPKPAKVKVGIVSCNAICGFRFMANEKGFFQEQGLEVEYLEQQNNVNLVKALIAGEIDILEQNIDPLLNAVGQGQMEASVIGSMNPGLSFVFFSHSSIKEPKDLIGKKIGISTPGALPHVLVENLLKQQGIDPKQVEYIATGSNPQRMQAMLAGKIDATATNFDFERLLVGRPDYHVAWTFTKYFPNYTQNGMAVTKAYVEKNRDVLVRFMAAYLKTARYAVNNPAETAKLVEQITKVKPDEALAGVQLYIKNGVMNPELTLKPEQLQYMIDLGAAANGYKAYPAGKIFDGSILEDARKLVK